MGSDAPTRYVAEALVLATALRAAAGVLPTSSAAVSNVALSGWLKFISPPFSAACPLHRGARRHHCTLWARRGVIDTCRTGDAAQLDTRLIGWCQAGRVTGWRCANLATTAASCAGKPSWRARALMEARMRVRACSSTRATAVRLRKASAVTPPFTFAKPLVGREAGQPMRKLAAEIGDHWPTRISPALYNIATSVSGSLTATCMCSGAYWLATSAASAMSRTKTAPPFCPRAAAA